MLIKEGFRPMHLDWRCIGNGKILVATAVAGHEENIFETKPK